MLSKKEKSFWDEYIQSLPSDKRPQHPYVESSVAGDQRNADSLLQLYLEKKKTAGSGLVKDYVLAEDPLPEVDNYWIVLDSQENPQCILQTIRVETHLFKNMTEEIAKAEGEGDSSLSFWKQAHRIFFEPYLQSFGILDLEEEEVITEFFELVYVSKDSIDTK